MKNRYLLLFSAMLSLCSCDQSIRSLLGRRRRALLYPEPRGTETKVQVLFGLGLPMEEEISMTLGYVLKCNYNLPYNSSLFTSSPSFSERQHLSRWSLYRLLESILGKSCLLRMVCEAAAVPFLSRERQGTTGLLGELLHALLTPSMTSEEYEIYADREYTAAEEKGKGEGCRTFLQDCPRSPLDYFSRILHL